MQTSKRQVEDTLHPIQYLLIHKITQVMRMLNYDVLQTVISEQNGVSIRFSQVSLKIQIPKAA